MEWRRCLGFNSIGGNILLLDFVLFSRDSVQSRSTESVVI